MTMLKTNRDGLLRFGLAIIVFIVLSATISNFATVGNMYTVFESLALTGIVAVGVAVTVIAGEFDLSVGSVAACAGIIAVQMAQLGLVPAIAIAAVIGVAYGALQGWAIHKLAIPSIVFTLGTFIGIRGLAYVLSNETTVALSIEELSIGQVLRQQLWIFSPFSLMLLIVVILLWLFLKYTRVGREIYALGGARKESRAAGVPQGRGLIISFAISGGLASLAGAMASMRAASATPTNYDWLLLSAVAAVLIGGVSLYGGRGSVVGVLLGAITLQLLISGLTLSRAPFWAASLATGLLMLLALLIDLVSTSSVLRRFFRTRFSSRKTPLPAPAAQIALGKN